VTGPLNTAPCHSFWKVRGLEEVDDEDLTCVVEDEEEMSCWLSVDFDGVAVSSLR
jgi:hypothetical protein